MNPSRSSLHKVPVYQVRLVKAPRPPKLAEVTLAGPEPAARAIHALIALTDREHLAALFINGANQITGAHVVSIGAQYCIGTIDVRVIFRAALAACASAIVLGHYVPRHIIAILFPT